MRVAKRILPVLAGIFAIAAVAFIFLDSVKIIGKIGNVPAEETFIKGTVAIFGEEGGYTRTDFAIITHALLLGGGVLMLVGGRIKLIKAIAYAAIVVGTVGIFLYPEYFARANTIILGSVGSITRTISLATGGILTAVGGCISALLGTLAIALD